MSDSWPPLKLRGADPTMDYSSWPSSECSPRIMTALDHTGSYNPFFNRKLLGLRSPDPSCYKVS